MKIKSFKLKINISTRLIVDFPSKHDALFINKGKYA